MLFFINSRMCPGVTRDQIVKHLKADVDKKTWELIKEGIIAHWFFKKGDQPGVVALLNCDNMEEARRLLKEAPMVKNGLLEFDIDPVDHFPHFE